MEDNKSARFNNHHRLQATSSLARAKKHNIKGNPKCVQHELQRELEAVYKQAAMNG
jgi:hypothetical protein